MKNHFIFLSTIFLSATLFQGCKNADKSKVNVVVENTTASNVAVTYNVVPKKAILNWKAEQIGGGHHGTFNIESGSILMEDINIVSGSFIIDVKSLIVIDVTEKEDNKDIVAHLLNPDFFDSEKFPVASFTISSHEGTNLKGNLKMKGIEKNISFPIKLDIKEDTIKITSSEFTIDRTVWGITKSSGKFFDPVKLGDHLIKDDVKMSISITAKK